MPPSLRPPSHRPSYPSPPCPSLASTLPLAYLTPLSYLPSLPLALTPSLPLFPLPTPVPSDLLQGGGRAEGLLRRPGEGEKHRRAEKGYLIVIVIVISIVSIVIIFLILFVIIVF